MKSQRALCLSLARCNLFGLNRSDSCRANVQPVQQIECQILKRFGFIGRVGVSVVCRIVAINQRDIGKVNDLLIENLELPEGLYSSSRCVCGFLI
ncbi:hypothetical protein AOX55_00001745 [Sinorhizobium fredii CCBAU 25509]|nr:hypothetical protein AOX55_00001745 [Sinorhizobium fredii CCBAU 25509]